MISRVTALAAVFAVLATATLSFAATVQYAHVPPATAAKPVRVVQLEPVVIVAKRS